MKKTLILALVILSNTANAGLIFNRDKNKQGCEESLRALNVAIEKNLIARSYNLGITDQYIAGLKQQINNLESDVITRKLSAKTISNLKEKLNDNLSDRYNQKNEAINTQNFIREQQEIVMKECYHRQNVSSDYSLVLFNNPLED